MGSPLQRTQRDPRVTPLSPDWANGRPAGALRAAHRFRAHASSHVLRIDGNCHEEAWAAVGHVHQVTVIPSALGPPGAPTVGTWTAGCLAGCFPAVSGVIDPDSETGHVKNKATRVLSSKSEWQGGQHFGPDPTLPPAAHTHSLLRSHAAPSRADHDAPASRLPRAGRGASPPYPRASAT